MKINNGYDTLTPFEFLLWERDGAKASWECSPMQPQPSWDELSEEDKLDQIAQQIENDFSLLTFVM